MNEKIVSIPGLDGVPSERARKKISQRLEGLEAKGNKNAGQALNAVSLPDSMRFLTEIGGEDVDDRYRELVVRELEKKKRGVVYRTKKYISRTLGELAVETKKNKIRNNEKKFKRQIEEIEEKKIRRGKEIKSSGERKSQELERKVFSANEAIKSRDVTIDRERKKIKRNEMEIKSSLEKGEFSSRKLFFMGGVWSAGMVTDILWCTKFGIKSVFQTLQMMTEEVFWIVVKLNFGLISLFDKGHDDFWKKNFSMLDEKRERAWKRYSVSIKKSLIVLQEELKGTNLWISKSDQNYGK